MCEVIEGSDLFAEWRAISTTVSSARSPVSLPVQAPKQARIGDQAQDSKCDWSRRATDAHCSSRRGDRVRAPTLNSPAVAPEKPATAWVRGRLFRKYVGLFLAVVCIALLTNGLSEIVFSFQEHKTSLIRIQREQAEAAAAKISQFIKEIESQVGWTTQLPWSAGTIDQRRFDGLRLLRQVPAITELSQLDSTGREQLRVSRLAMDVDNTPATRALQQATSTIPIVFALVLDPVASGVVTNLARPGGNVTGFTNFEVSMGGKWLEFLKEVSPRITRVALIFNPHTAPYVGMLRTIEAAAPSFVVDITTRGVTDATELTRAIVAAGRESGTALIVFPDIFTAAHHQQIIALATQHRLPAIYPYRYFTAGGGLMSYGIDTPDLFRRTAGYLDRVLKGEKPGSLPVQAPNKFAFIINLKTANAIGLDVPSTLIARADEVIE